MGESPTTKPQVNHQSETPRRSRSPSPFPIYLSTMPPNHPSHFPTTTINDDDDNSNNFISNNNSIKNNNSNSVAGLSINAQPRSSTQACAACKYQRRKCASDCVLAPYFPHDRQRQFLNAHRLFGVSNIIKIVRHLDPSAKDHAMRTIIFQSDARAADPVGGCYRMIRDLEERISLAKAELDIVLQHFAICRAAAAQQQQMMPAPDGGDSAMNAGILGVYEGEKWRGEFVGENEVVNSWGCNFPANVNAESPCDSFPQQNDNNNNHFEEGNNDIRPLLEQLTCDDDDGHNIDGNVVKEEDEFKFDCNGNIVPSSNDFLAEEEGEYNNIKDEEDCFSCVEDHNDLKAATFFSLTNCDI